MLLLQELISPGHTGYGVGGTQQGGPGCVERGWPRWVEPGKGGGVKMKVSSQSLANLQYQIRTVYPSSGNCTTSTVTLTAMTPLPPGALH